MKETALGISLTLLPGDNLKLAQQQYNVKKKIACKWEVNDNTNERHRKQLTTIE